MTSPRWKVYNHVGEYVASCRYVEDAAALCANWGYGATIRDGHGPIAFTNGTEADAADSYDAVADIVTEWARSRGAWGPRRR